MSGRHNSCIFGCDTLGVSVHSFPNKKRRLEVLEKWLAIIPRKLTADDSRLRHLKVCDYHFKMEHRTRGHRVTVDAIPSLYLKGVPKLVADFDREHNYCMPRPFQSSFLSVPPTTVQQDTGISSTNHEGVQTVKLTTSQEPIQEVYVPTNLHCFKPDVGVSLGINIPKSEVCESTDIPCDPLETCVSTDISCGSLRQSDLLERCVSNDKPCDPVESISMNMHCNPSQKSVSTNIPSYLEELRASTEKPWDPGECCVLTDIPCNPSQKSVSTNIPSDLEELRASTEKPWDPGECCVLTDIPCNPVDNFVSTDIPYNPVESCVLNDRHWDISEVCDSNDIPWDLEVCESVDIPNDVPEVSVSPMPSDADAPTPNTDETQTLCQVPTNVPPKGIKDYQREIINLKKKIKRMQAREESLKIRLAKASKIAQSAITISNNMSEEARIFIQLQCRESGKKSKGHRFSEEEKKLALSLMNKNPTGYSVLSEYFCLPSARTLRPERLNWTKNRLDEDQSGEKSSVIYDAFVAA